MLFKMGGLISRAPLPKKNGAIALAVSVGIYLGLYFLLLRPTHASASALALLPVMVAGGFFGLRTGMLVGMACFASNLLLPVISGYMNISETTGTGGLLGGAALIIAGAITGLIRDQRLALHRELQRRKKTEAALQISQNRLTQISHYIRDIVCYTDHHGTIIYINPAFTDMLGYPVEYALGRQIFDFLHPDDREQAIQKFHSLQSAPLKETINWRSEYRCQKINGENLWLETISNTMEDEENASRQFIFTGRDITQRKNQENQMQETNDMVRALVNSPDEISCLIDREGKILEINQAAASRLQTTAKDLLGKNILDYSGYLREKRQMHMQQALRDGRSIRFEEQTDHHYFETTIHPIASYQNRYDQLAVFVRDITTYKQAEQAEREQRLMAEALANTAEILSGTLNFNEVLNHILDSIQNVVPYEAAEVMLLENEQVRVVRYHTWYGHKNVSALEHGMPIKTMNNLVQVVASHQPLLITDTDAYPDWVVYPDSRWVKSYVCSPIEIQGVVVGFLNIFHSQPGFYKETHADRLISFADQAALALQNARLYSAAQSNARQMQVLNDITQAALNASDPTSLLNSLTDNLGELFNTQGIYITRYDEASGQVTSVAAAEPYRQTYMNIRFSANIPNLTQSALNLGQVLAVDDICDSPYSNPAVSQVMPNRSILTIPLIADGRKLGAVLIGHEQPHHFDENEITLAERAGGQIALAITKSELIEAERRQSARLSRANQLITSLGQVAAKTDISANVDDILSAVGNELKSMGFFCLAALGTQPEKEMNIRYLSAESRGIRLAESLSGLSLRDFTLSASNFISYPQLVNERQPVYLPQIDILMDYFSSSFQRGVSDILIKAMHIDTHQPAAFLPLVVKEQVIGLLGLTKQDLSEEDVPSLSLFSSELANALEKSRLHEEIQRLSITDDLCGIYNRRGLFAFGEHEVERALRFNRPMSIMMMDIDLFKKANDKLGHLAGDQILRAFADCCQANVRDVDIVGRYGGDEFVVLLVESDQQASLAAAERLRTAIKKLKPSGEGWQFDVTVSCGMTTLTSDTPNLEALINRADKALYKAKRQGRDQVYWL